MVRMKLLKLPLPRLAVNAAAILASVSALCAEPLHPVKPLLWKVEGPGLAKPSYLFGTMHIGDKAVVTLHPAAEKAFEASTTVHTEAQLDMKSQMASMADMMRADGKSLDDVIGKDLSERLAAELKAIRPELDAAPFQPMKTWMVAYSLPFLAEQMAGIKPLDLVLWERAEKAGKKTAGMQEIKDQVSGFNKLTEDEQTEFLKSSLDFLEKDRREGKDTMKEAAAIYLTGDVAKINVLADEWLQELTGGKDNAVGKKLLQSIMVERDVIMADYIDATLKKDPEGVHFFAAGAGHYAGEKGVPFLLGKRGYKITRIEQ
jgi:uncharacterized protein